MLLIGICGASGSGKTTLARELKRRLGEQCVMLSQDAYYLDHAELSPDERSRLNYDAPGMLDHELMYQDVCALLSGQCIPRRRYDFVSHSKRSADGMIAPADVLIVEGIHAFYDERLRNKMRLKLFMEVEPDICLLRRIRRDIKERGRDIDSIAEQYVATVKPMYEKYIRPYGREADLSVLHGGKNARVADLVVCYLRSALQKTAENSIDPSAERLSL